MKILITENQLEKLVKKYINTEFNKLIISKSMVYNEGHSLFWATKHGKFIMEYAFTPKSLFIMSSFFNEIMNIFNLSESQTYNIFIEWGKEKINKKLGDIITV